MTKTQAQAALTHKLNTYVLGLTYKRLVTNEQLKRLQDEVMPVLTKELNLGLTLDFLSDITARNEYEESFERMLKRSAIREGFESVKAYFVFCKSKRVPISWAPFDFSRALRNIVSHGSMEVLSRWPRELTKEGIQEVTWRNRTLKASEVGLPVSMTTSEVALLLLDMAHFIRDFPETSNLEQVVGRQNLINGVKGLPL